MCEKRKLRRKVNAVEVKKRMKKKMVSPNKLLLLYELKIECDLVNTKKLEATASDKVL